jgi:hypothetical protein
VAEFAAQYELLSKTEKADLKYLFYARVRAFYKDGQLVGGYAVSTLEMNRDLRYFSFLNPDQRSYLLNKGFKANQYAEITYTLVNIRKVSLKENVKVMLFSFWDAFCRGKKFIMGGGVIKHFNVRMQCILKTVFFDDNVMVSGEPKNFKNFYNSYLVYHLYATIGLME